MIKAFIENFIKNKYKERILYELNSDKSEKREKAFTKLLEYEEFFKNDFKKIDLSHLNVDEILNIINNSYYNKSCYSLRYDCELKLDKAIIDQINRCILDILIIDEKNIVYIGEVYHNKDGGTASSKFIAYK